MMPVWVMLFAQMWYFVSLLIYIGLVMFASCVCLLSIFVCLLVLVWTLTFLSHCSCRILFDSCSTFVLWWINVYITVKTYSVQPPRSTIFISLSLSLSRPPTSSSLLITDRFFWFAPSCLWNQLPASLHQPRLSLSVSISSCSCHIIFLCWFSTLIIRNSLALSGLEPTCFTAPFHRTFSSSPALSRWPIFWATEILIFSSFPYFSLFLVPCVRLSWLAVSFWAHVNASYRIV